VKRSLLMIAVGLIGLLLGVGLSLVADAVAGNELSDPVPLGLATDHLRSPRRDSPPATNSPKHGEEDDQASGGASGAGGSTETESPPSPEPTPTHADEGSDVHEGDSSGGSQGSSGDDD
jgi:hypothetical protein